MVFLVALFLLKNGLLFKNTVDFIQGNQASGLAYDANITVGDLVNKDTDGDGVLDWEEPLYGLDPTKRETTPGIPDSTAMAKMKAIQGNTEQGLPSLNGATSTQNLTQTDKFSQELFSTVAALNQNGEVSQDTVNQIGDSMAANIKNSSPRKVYLISDIKTSKDESASAIQNYAINLNNFYKAYKVDYTVMDVLQKFIIDANNVDVSALTELDPIIEQTNKITKEIAGMNVPQSLASLHLDLLNTTEKVAENLSDIKLYETDAVVALSGISQYQDNVILMQNALQKLIDTINAIGQKLNN